MSQAGFWDNQEKAQAIVNDLKGLNSVLKPLEELLAEGDDLGALVEMTEEDASLEPELQIELDRT